MKQFVLILFSAILSACSAHYTISARLYNLNDGKTIALQFETFNLGYGLLHGVTDDGTKLSGEYSLAKVYEMRGMGGFAAASPESHIEKMHGTATDKESATWTEMYGFSPEYAAKPAGSGVLTDGQGEIISIVLYNVNQANGYADGIAKSNKGQWYKVHAGNTTTVP